MTLGNDYDDALFIRNFFACYGEPSFTLLLYLIQNNSNALYGSLWLQPTSPRSFSPRDLLSGTRGIRDHYTP